MNTTKSARTLLAIGVAGVMLFGTGLVAQAGDDVRPAYCAGSWYPGDSAALAKQIDDALASEPPPEAAGKPVALIAPHAGYRYSAPVAAAAYRCLKGHNYKRVIVLAFSHRNAGRYSGVDVPAELRAYKTPLGEVPIDREVCDALLNDEVFASHPGIDRGEHSLELQLPFLQRALGEFRLVPLLVGQVSLQTHTQAAAALLPWLDDETLLVASSDFTHYGPNFGYQPFKENVRDGLQGLADQASAPILRCDFDGFVEHIAKTNDTICGRGPITLLLRALSMQGGADAVRVAVDLSGRMSDDWTSSVTYQSFVFTRRTGTLGAADRDALLKTARRTVTAYLKDGKVPGIVVDTLPQAIKKPGGCFVTLENHGRLRGCIGNMIARGPLYQAVVQNAVSACRDGRFVTNPVTAEELDQIDIEISYLTPMKLVGDIKDIVVGRHGLMIALDDRRGVLLPQVAYERGWTREEFLAQTCRKAGLGMDSWKDTRAEIHSFEAEVFGESD